MGKQSNTSKIPKAPHLGGHFVKIQVLTLGVKRAGPAGVLLVLLSVQEKPQLGFLFKGYGSIRNAGKQNRRSLLRAALPGWCVLHWGRVAEVPP